MDKKEITHIKHEFAPIYDETSRVLVLGTLPSVRSREQNFYYGHPQNRFWRVIAHICEETIPISIDEKKKMLIDHHIALWDVIAECDIRGSSDSSIKNVVPSDLSVILNNAPIEQIYANGAKAYDLYMKYSYPVYRKEITRLPSTSPANAACNMDMLAHEWKRIINKK